MVVERDEQGRLKKGSVLNPTGRGADAVALLSAALKGVKAADVKAVFDKLHARAMRGDTRSAELWLSYVVGKPVQRNEVSGIEGAPPIVLREVVIERSA